MGDGMVVGGIVVTISRCAFAGKVAGGGDCWSMECLHSFQILAHYGKHSTLA